MILEKNINAKNIAHLTSSQDIILAISYDDEKHLSRIIKLSTDPGHAYLGTLLITSGFIEHITLSERGVIWAIDYEGHIYCSENTISSTIISDKLQLDLCGEQWSFCRLMYKEIKSIMTKGSDLLMLDADGDLIRYDSKNFYSAGGFNNVIKIKAVSGRYFAIGHNNLVSELIGRAWKTIPVAKGLPLDMVITDITIQNKEIIVVTNNGYILSKHENSPSLSMILLCNENWIGCEEIEGDTYIISKNNGVFLLTGNKINPVENYDITVTHNYHYDRDNIIIQSAKSTLAFSCNYEAR